MLILLNNGYDFQDIRDILRAREDVQVLQPEWRRDLELLRKLKPDTSTPRHLIGDYYFL